MSAMDAGYKSLNSAIALGRATELDYNSAREHCKIKKKMWGDDNSFLQEPE